MAVVKVGWAAREETLPFFVVCFSILFGTIRFSPNLFSFSYMLLLLLIS